MGYNFISDIDGDVITCENAEEINFSDIPY
jgi:hypothetical protein